MTSSQHAHIFCPQCGHHNPDGQESCSRCHARLPRKRAPLQGDTRQEIRHTFQDDASVGLDAHHTDPEEDPSSITITSDERPAVQISESSTPSRSLLPAPPSVSALPQDAHARLTIGYDVDNDLVIPRPNISAHHAVLAFSPSTHKVYLRDLNSTNGTTVNHHPIDCAIVRQGDLVGLGSYTFTLEQELIERLVQSVTYDPGVTQAVQAISPAARQRPIVIGRDQECDIVLDAPQISRRHVKLVKLPTGGWLVEDLASANGTFLNDRNASPLSESTEASERDILYMGSYRFPLSRISDFMDLDHRDDSGDARKASLAMQLDKKIITIGRGPDNDIVLDAPQISRHHARLLRKDKQIFIEDLASANGTFLNGKRIGRAPISPEDTLSFGTYTVKLDLARGAIEKNYQGDIILQAENIRVDVPGEDGGTRRLLDDISFTAYPTEFVGLMGPSGAGKTTLLMSLIGYLKPSTGRTLLNGDELSAHYDRYRGTIGYVPQEDIIHDELTVYEALYYTAKLRLPTDTSDEEIEQRIATVLANLEIARAAHVRIGSPTQKGISGGQRKRVNLAMELLTEPSLLCLDEPTSGLASEDAANVIRLLRRLADEGRTILLTIHQPSLQVYRLLDNVIYLADGEQVYYGPTYPDSILYFHPRVRPGTPQAEEILADPGSCLRPLVDAQRAGEPMETFAARYRQSSYHREYVDERRKNQSSDVELSSQGQPSRIRRFRFHQLFVLSRRYLNIKFKDRLGMAILLCQAPIIAIFVVLVFMGQDHGALNRMEYMPFALFLLVISAIWFGCSNAAREIVSEQAIYTRERMVNLSIPAYVGSKFIVLAALALAQCMALLGITYIGLDMVGNPVLHLLVLWACTLAATGMGLTLSAAVRTPAASLALVPMLLIPQVILGGAIMPIDRMQDPSWTIAQTTVSRWGFEGVLQVEELAAGYELSASEIPRPFAPGLPAPPPPPNPLDRFFGDAETSLLLCVAVILAFMAVAVAMTALSLRIRES